ncbi:exocyst complex component EXO70B1-like [Phaseolus vulgaris]|uniref:exocyst complex component EXO70B1-like n=1 Tax=Phaseolus vulgaris TaxID=3885 RepID=UPI0035CC8591
MLAEGFEEDCCRAYYDCGREFLKECLWTFGLQMQELSMEDIDKMEKIQSWLRKVLDVVDSVLLPNEKTLSDRVFKGASSPGDFVFTVVCSELNISLLRIANHLAAFLKDSRSRQGLEKSIMLDKEGKLSPYMNVAREINNLRFIELQAELYGLVPTFGHGWLRKNRKKLQQNLELYLRSSWNKIVEFLKLDMRESESSVAVGLLKDRLNSFNEHFDEICNVECTWFVFGEELRKDIIKSIENMLPAYGNFIGKLQKFLGKHSYDYIKYGMFDIQDRVRNLFVVRENKNRFLKQSKKHM